jgi:diaminobutyrate-2-oxoglutarate transaminase
VHDISFDRATGASTSLDSNVVYYAKQFPGRFVKASGTYIWDDQGRRFTDFWAAAGSLNYGHNPPDMIRAVIDYLEAGGIVQSLDLETDAKQRFIDRFDNVILKPRDLSYRFLFAGPAGANAVEAALKLARATTKRRLIAAFTGAFHGMTLGALAVGDSAYARLGAGVPLGDVARLTYDDGSHDAPERLEREWRALFAAEAPAGVIVESFQCDGGMRAASAAWMQTLERLCRNAGAALIVDDIQAGNGRTGAFFSFESSGVKPDMICLSKSLSGAGFPMSLVLVRDSFDSLGAGQHTGTFRGFNLSFVAAVAALHHWEQASFAEAIALKGRIVEDTLAQLVSKHGASFVSARGRGLAYGLVCANEDIADRLSRALFERRVIAEVCGPSNDVLKIMPPLTISVETLHEALASLQEAAAALAG